MLAMLSGLLVPVFRPLGLGDWRICTSLISGFMAKESVVATLEVLFGSSIATVLTPLAAATLLVFSLLYTPCVAAIASVRRELGGKWAIAVVLWQCFVAWVAAFLVHGSECFWDENSIDKRILDRSVGVRSTKQFVGIKGGAFAPDIHI